MAKVTVAPKYRALNPISTGIGPVINIGDPIPASMSQETIDSLLEAKAIALIDPAPVAPVAAPAADDAGKKGK